MGECVGAQECTAKGHGGEWAQWGQLGPGRTVNRPLALLRLPTKKRAPLTDRAAGKGTSAVLWTRGGSEPATGPPPISVASGEPFGPDTYMSRAGPQSAASEKEPADTANTNVCQRPSARAVLRKDTRVCQAPAESSLRNKKCSWLGEKRTPSSSESCSSDSTVSRYSFFCKRGWEHSEAGRLWGRTTVGRVGGTGRSRAYAGQLRSLRGRSQDPVGPPRWWPLCRLKAQLVQRWDYAPATTMDHRVWGSSCGILRGNRCPQHLTGRGREDDAGTIMDPGPSGNEREANVPSLLALGKEDDRPRRPKAQPGSSSLRSGHLWVPCFLARVASYVRTHPPSL